MQKRSGQGRDVIKSSTVLSAMTMVSRILGLIRDMTRAAALGTSRLGEAFTVAFNIPNFLRRLFAEGSMSAAFIPVCKEYLVQDDEEKTREFLSATFTAILIMVGAAVVLGILCSDWIVLLFGSDRAETSLLTKIMFPFLALVSLAAFFQGILNSVGVFAPSGMAPIYFNLAFIALPPLFSPFLPEPAQAMAWAVSIGGLLQALCQLPPILRMGFRFGLMNPLRAFRHPGMRKVFSLVGPTILGLAAYNLNSLISVSLASSVGAATALNFSLRLQELVLGIFVVSLGTVILPILSGQAASGDWRGFNARMRSSIDAVTLVTLPVAVFSMIEGRDIVSLVFKAKAFSESSVALTTGAFFWHMTGLFFIGQNRILAPAFYACEDTKSPTWAGMASFAVNIAAAFLLVGPMKGNGLALALSLASAVNTAILVALLLKKGTVERKVLASSGLYVLRILGFSLAAGLAVKLLQGPLRAPFAASGNRLLSFGLPLLALSLVFGGIGLACLSLTKDQNMGSLLARFRRRAPK